MFGSVDTLRESLGERPTKFDARKRFPTKVNMPMLGTGVTENQRKRIVFL